MDAQCDDANYQMFANSARNYLELLSQIRWLGRTTSFAYKIDEYRHDPMLLFQFNQDEVSFSTGFCLPALYNGTKDICSDFPLKYGAAMLGSDYGRNQLQPGDY